MLPLTANLDLPIVPRRLLDAGFPMNEVTELFGYLTGMAVPLINLATIITAALQQSIVPAISHAFAKRDHEGIYDRTAWFYAINVHGNCTIYSAIVCTCCSNSYLDL